MTSSTSPPSEASGTAEAGARHSAVLRMRGEASGRLGRLHRKQVAREPEPDFASFDPSAWPDPMRREAASQWAGRARNEHASIQQFAQLIEVLATARAELELLGVLSRIVTDEVRHVSLCTRMALAIWPEGPELEPKIFAWPKPGTPWPDPPRARCRRWPPGLGGARHPHRVLPG